MADEFGEKTEPASAKRREQLHEQGDVAKSTDLAGVLTIAGTIIPLLFLSRFVMRDWIGLLDRMLSGRSTGNILKITSLYSDFALSFRTAFESALPFLISSFVVTAAAMAAQVGFRITFEPMQPNITKMNPIEGFKKFFKMSAAFELLSSITKVVIVLTVAVMFIGAHQDVILMLPRMELADAAVHAADLVMGLCIWLLVMLFILALADLIYQRWQWERDNRMSKEEIKEEAKNIMGDPKIKKRQREFAMQIMNQRTSQVVPQADVIVTNPEHLAIALKWDPGTMNAPKVLAKGADYMALRIRQIAALHGIPIVERKPLARAMYPIVQAGQEIPSQFYSAIAEILAYVYRLEGREAG